MSRPHRGVADGRRRAKARSRVARSGRGSRELAQKWAAAWWMRRTWAVGIDGRRGRGPAGRFRGAVLGLTVLVWWTLAALLRSHRRAGLRAAPTGGGGSGLRALAAQLRIGQVPSVALASAAGDQAVLREARDAQDLGGDVVRSLAQPGAAPRLCGSARASSGLAGVRGPARRCRRPWSRSPPHSWPSRTRALSWPASLAPGATGKVMAVLPGCGVGLGYLLGGEPIGWLLGDHWADCLLAGAVLASLGVLWIEALAGQRHRDLEVRHGAVDGLGRLSPAAWAVPGSRPWRCSG